MSIMRSSILQHSIVAAVVAMAAATPGARPVYGQAVELRVSVVPTGITTAGATTSITYSVENAGESLDSLAILVLDAQVEPTETAIPPAEPPPGYMVRYGYGNMKALSLGFLDRLNPGERRGPFTVRATGLPTIVPYWVVPSLPIDEVIDETEPAGGEPEGDAFTPDDRAGLTV